MSLKFIALRELESSYRKAANLCAKAEARAVKRAVTTVTANQARAIVQKVNLKVAPVKAAIRTIQQPSAGAPRAVIEVKFKGVPLSEFGARQVKRGVAVTIRRGQRTTLRAAFYSPKSKSFLGRVQKGGDRYGSPHVGRLPVIRLWGPSIFEEFIAQDVQQLGDKVWSARIEIELDRETRFALSQAGLI